MSKPGVWAKSFFSAALGIFADGAGILEKLYYCCWARLVLITEGAGGAVQCLVAEQRHLETHRVFDRLREGKMRPRGWI